MVGGLLKLVYPDGEFSKEQLEEILKLAWRCAVALRNNSKSWVAWSFMM